MLDIAVAAADAAGAIIRDRARDAGEIAWHLKSHSDFVTEVDTAAEQDERKRRVVVARIQREVAVRGEPIAEIDDPNQILETCYLQSNGALRLVSSLSDCPDAPRSKKEIGLEVEAS